MNQREIDLFEDLKAKLGLEIAVTTYFPVLDSTFLNTFEMDDLCKLIRELHGVQFLSFKEKIFLAYLNHAKDHSLEGIAKNYSKVMYFIPQSIQERGGWHGEILLFNIIQEKCGSDRDAWTEIISLLPNHSFLQKEAIKELRKTLNKAA